MASVELATRLECLVGKGNNGITAKKKLGGASIAARLQWRNNRNRQSPTFSIILLKHPDTVMAKEEQTNTIGE